MAKQMSQKSARYEDPNTLPIYGPLLYFRAVWVGKSQSGEKFEASPINEGPQNNETARSKNIHMHPIVLLMKNHVGDDMYPRQRSTASKAAFPLPLSDAYCATCKSQENF